MSKIAFIRVEIVDEDTGVVTKTFINSISDCNWRYEFDKQFEIMCKRTCDALEVSPDT